MAEYEVKQGDCIYTIALKHGHFWETIWNDSNNKALKDKGRKPNALFPGDKVFIPDLQPKKESVAAGESHGFRRKGTHTVLRLRFSEGPNPRADQPVTLHLGEDRETRSQSIEQRTNDKGEVEITVPVVARRATLIVGEGEEEESYKLYLGHLDPVDEISGIQMRLKSLGFDCGKVDNDLGPNTRSAIKEFQKAYGIEPADGEPSGPTKAKLEEIYGC